MGLRLNVCVEMVPGFPWGLELKKCVELKRVCLQNINAFSTAVSHRFD